MSNVTLGRITSEPNDKGEHSLKCPSCAIAFQSRITKDDATHQLNPVICPRCAYAEEPKHFLAAAHQSEVNRMAMEYVKKAFGKL